MRILFTLLFLLFVTACSHPLEIIGEGDIRSDSGKHDCLLENQPCANHVTGDYFETYSGVPRPGWIFAGWQGCGIQYPQCNLNAPASVVDQNWFKKMPALRALFTPELEPGVPGVRVGSVRGNTVNFGSAAEFAISLNTAPADDVTISMTSTDETEGLPEVSEVTFTSANWSRAQTIVVRGQNGAPDDHTQDYHILFGPASSSDVAYDGIATPAVAMKGLSVELVLPPQPINLLSNIEIQQGIEYEYTGYDAPIFALTVFPAGMEIDPGTGILTWTPQESDEGLIFPVAVTVTDGVVNDEVMFEVGVFQPESLMVTNTDSSVTIDDLESDLNGLTIAAVDRQPQSNFSQLGIDSIPIGDAPDMPPWITPLSDVLVLPESLDEALELRFSIVGLPQGVELDDVNVYAAVNLEDTEKRTWVPVSLDFNYEGTEKEPIYVAKLARLSGMALIGYHEQEPLGVFRATAQSLNEPEASIECASICEPHFNTLTLQTTYSLQYCTAPETKSGFKATIADFPKAEWLDVEICELSDWLLDAQNALDKLGLDYDEKISVRIHPMDEFGAVYPISFRKIIHLDSDAYPKDVVKYTTVHEYFHNAQARTHVLGEFNMINNVFNKRWMTEGSATWFEDFVYDAEDPWTLESKYLPYTKPITEILRYGLNANAKGGYKKKSI